MWAHYTMPKNWDSSGVESQWAMLTFYPNLVQKCTYFIISCLNSSSCCAFGMLLLVLAWFLPSFSIHFNEFDVPLIRRNATTRSMMYLFLNQIAWPYRNEGETLICLRSLVQLDLFWNWYSPLLARKFDKSIIKCVCTHLMLVGPCVLFAHIHI